MNRLWMLWTLLFVVVLGAEDKQANFSSIVPLTISDIWGLNGQIEIGTPGQPLDVRFDLESSSIALNATGHYNSSASSSFIDMDASIWMGFDDGSSAQVWLGNESFDIGGMSFHNVPFLRIGEFLPSADRDTFDTYAFGGSAGTLGLNFFASQGFEFAYDPSFMWAIKRYLPAWVYTLDLYRTSNNGTCRFGTIDSSEYAGDIGWSNLNAEIPVFSVGAVNLSVISAGNRTSRTSRTRPDGAWLAFLSNDLTMVWPQDVLDWYFNGTNAVWSSSDRTYRYPCNSTLPDVMFGFGNGTFRVPGSYLPYQRDADSRTCTTIITAPANTSDPFSYTFGLRWAQMGMLILDYENTRVGFASKSTPLPSFPVSSLPYFD